MSLLDVKIDIVTKIPKLEAEYHLIAVIRLYWKNECHKIIHL